MTNIGTLPEPEGEKMPSIEAQLGYLTGANSIETLHQEEIDKETIVTARIELPGVLVNADTIYDFRHGGIDGLLPPYRAQKATFEFMFRGERLGNPSSAAIITRQWGTLVFDGF